MVEKGTLLHLNWQIYDSYVGIIKLINNFAIAEIQSFELKKKIVYNSYAFT